MEVHYNQCMIIYNPPSPVEGAPNLSKGKAVFDVTRNIVSDIILTSKYAEDQAILDLMEIHDSSYVHDVFLGTKPNGYGIDNPKVNDHSAHSCVIMRDAAITALAAAHAGIPSPVFAPVSGFHHSGYAYGGGYCTFNGLVLAADAVRKKIIGANVLIIDGDGHWGDGTDDLITIGGRDWLHQCSLDKGSTGGDAGKSFAALRHALGLKQWDAVLYQAGADSHEDDPYMAGYLNDDEWKYRDEIIFKYCFDNEVPCVFNLAGGYNGTKTILLHTSTVSTARRVYGESSRNLL
jgi:acetoin utilization deacetylase AcuC-like enzyme